MGDPPEYAREAYSISALVAAHTLVQYDMLISEISGALFCARWRGRVPETKVSVTHSPL